MQVVSYPICVLKSGENVFFCNFAVPFTKSGITNDCYINYQERLFSACPELRFQGELEEYSRPLQHLTPLT